MLLENTVQLIGNSPLVRLGGFCREKNLSANLFAKLEWFSLSGSVKDRVALSIISDWEKQGKLTPSTVIIEPTSGNTGIGLAALGSIKGYKVILVMPESMSIERRKMIAAYGAEIVLTPASAGMSGAIAKAEQLHAELKESIIAGQFTNLSNPAAHFAATGPEIWEDTKGKVDIFVAGAGTGGTLSGVGRFLKMKNPSVQIIAVEPAESQVIGGGKPGAHGIQGIGAGFIPENLKVELLDGVVAVSTENAIATARELAHTDGLLIGISSGAALYASMIVALRPGNAGKNIVVLMPDNASKYMSTALL